MPQPRPFVRRSTRRSGQLALDHTQIHGGFSLPLSKIWVVVFTRSRPATQSPAYPARLSRLLRLTSIASTEYWRPLSSLNQCGTGRARALLQLIALSSTCSSETRRPTTTTTGRRRRRLYPTVLGPSCSSIPSAWSSRKILEQSAKTSHTLIIVHCYSLSFSVSRPKAHPTETQQSPVTFVLLFLVHALELHKQIFRR